MFKLISLLAFLLCTVRVESNLRTTISWSADLHAQFFRDNPLITKYGDEGIAVATTSALDDEGVFNLTVRAYKSEGQLVNTCQHEVQYHEKRLSPGVRTYVTSSFGKSSIVVSWITSRDQWDGSLILHVVDLEDCSHYHKTIVIHGPGAKEKYFSGMKTWVPPDFLLPSYSIVSRDQESADLYLWSSDLCGKNLCNISLTSPKNLKQLTEPNLSGKVSPMDIEGSKFYKILPIDSKDLSKGYFYVTRELSEDSEPAIKINKLDADGKILKTFLTNLKLDRRLLFESNYESAALCSWEKCQLFDSSLNIKVLIDGMKDYTADQCLMTIFKDSGLLLLQELNRRSDHESSLRVTEVKGDGTGEKYDMFKTKIENNRMRNDYEGVAIEKNDMYCVAQFRPKEKEGSYERFYDMYVECINTASRDGSSLI